VSRKQSQAQRTLWAHKRMLAVAEEALKSQHKIAQAKSWYPDRCGDVIHRMQSVSGMNEWQCCVILAATSANTRWHDNVRRAIQAAEYIGGRDVPFPSGPPYHVDNILWAGFHRHEPEHKLTGRKTSNFARAIYGDETAVTVDLWMCMAAQIKNRNRKPVTNPGRGTHYDVVEDAIVHVSADIGMSPRDTQALIWIQVRGSAD